MDSNTYSAIEDTQKNARVTALVEKLREKLKGFVVTDGQGQFVGNVKDLTLDKSRQISLIVAPPSTNPDPQLFLLMSRAIQKIDPSSKTIFVDISKANIERSHRYEPKAQDKVVPTVPEDLVQKRIDTNTLEASDQYTISNTSTTDMPAQSFEAVNQAKVDEHSRVESLPTSEVLEEEIIRLLEERLVVDHNRHKVGEIIVRKEIETRMIQVPVRREKLIIEQVSPEYKQLAEIDLGQEEIADNNSPENLSTAENSSTATKSDRLDGKFTVSGTFNSPKTASLLLNAIALERQHGSKEVRMEIVVEDASRQKTYQEWFDRCSKQQ